MVISLSLRCGFRRAGNLLHLPSPTTLKTQVVLAPGGFSNAGNLQCQYKGYLECVTEKAMAPHSSTLACKTPWTEELGRLQSMGSLGVGHD